MEYIRGSRAPECIFYKQYKTGYTLFSPDSAVSCVADMLVSDLEIYILCSVLLHFIEESVISGLSMVAFRRDKWILVTFFLQYYLGNISMISVTDV